MTTLEIRMQAIRTINQVITLKANVANGCNADKAELAEQEARLTGIKEWAIANNQLQEIRLYLAQKNFGQNAQFAASEIANYFNN